MSGRFGVSVVMPVYAGARAPYLRRALESLFAQSRLPDEIVVVEDGPITPKHVEILESFERCSHTLPLRRIKIEHNVGAGQAIQLGVQCSRFPWVARMDADDISLPDRLQIQVDLLRRGAYDIVGGAMLEFLGEEERIVGLRQMPEDQIAITNRLRTSNPFNHPTVVFRRELALSVGGYRTLPYLEDYDFFARMMAAGALAYNIKTPLLLFRTGPDVFGRRRTREAFRSEWQLQCNLRDYGLIAWPRAFFNFGLRNIFRMLPPSIMSVVYRRIYYARTA